ncbi:YbaB/EbfC family nucleoid-associated protein [Lentzea sp.]|uniref:YbaB/EbfC family nucleoid-associated protein n=1 Tax=Lentzea sp. TaxID=56099 RepID=UPI002BFC0424|nr:YbaB/EbfC family nucleoid-associated protein [Lentzea sp.]HUQ59541.1 YbaB/EbfC family nucleoid-associated protein [Lentzea sp.]
MGEDNRRWGFEEAEDREFERRPQPPAQQDDSCVGTDASGAVSVVVEPDGRVREVRLTARWRDTLDPRALGAAVLTAANNATMQALSRNVEAQGDLAAVEPPSPSAEVDETPFTRADAERLFAAVNAELAAFAAGPGSTVNALLRAESRAGHVSGTARSGRVVRVEIDGHWLHAAPTAEVEGELAEVLRSLHDRGTPPSPPSGPAITRLQALASDPARLLRKVGLA